MHARGLVLAFETTERFEEHSHRGRHRRSGEQVPWAGSRPMTPEGLPVIGKRDATKNVDVNSGHSMLGLTVAPGSVIHSPPQ